MIECILNGKKHILYHIENETYYSVFFHKRDNINRRRYWIKRNCDFCNKEHFSDRNNFKKYKKSFCCKECLNKYNSERQIKDKKISKGYILIHSPDHPNNKKHFMQEHRLIMEKEINRYLKENEIVHHIDFDKSNNKIENLDLLNSTKDHNLCHWSLIELAKELLNKNLITYNKLTHKYEMNV